MNKPGPSRIGLLILGAIAMLVAGCSDAREERQTDVGALRRYGERDLTTAQRHGGGYLGGSATGDTRDGAVFARWVLEQDPDRRYISDAVVRDEQVLGVKLQPGLTKAQVRELLEALARGMARSFPGRPLQVNAFDQSGDRTAEAVYNPRVERVDVRFT